MFVDMVRVSFAQVLTGCCEMRDSRSHDTGKTIVIRANNRILYWGGFCGMSKEDNRNKGLFSHLSLSLSWYPPLDYVVISCFIPVDYFFAMCYLLVYDT
jgi:hypothetical protein